MGLDQYFMAERSVWPHEKVEGKVKEIYDATIEIYGDLMDDNQKVAYIKFQAGYLRKANAIHALVSNFGDDLTNVYLDEESLESMLKTINETLDIAEVAKGKIKYGQRFVDGKWEDVLQDGEYVKNAEEVAKKMPTMEGFFFGSTEYDEYYLMDLRDAKKIVENCLTLSKQGFDIYYQGSW